MPTLGEVIRAAGEDARKRRRRPKKATPKKFAADIGLGGSTPFEPAQREQRKRTRKASKALPSRPSAKETGRAYRETFPDHHERALIEVFEAQAPRVRQRILARARRDGGHDAEIILRHARSQNPYIATREHASPFKAFSETAKVAAEGAAGAALLPARGASELGVGRAVASGISSAIGLIPRGSGTSSAVVVPGVGAGVGVGGNQSIARALSVPLLAGMGTTEGLARGGPRAWGGTAQGGAELIAGTIGAIPSLLIRGTQDPAGTARDLATAQGEDWSRRYGPLTDGGYDEFVERIEDEGAAPEIADIAAIGGGATSAVGRGIGMAARRGALGQGARRIATERPDLRVTPGKSVEQDVGRNFFRALGQAGQDAVRHRAQQRREGREFTRGLIPDEGEVVKTTLRGQDRRQRREHSALGSRSNMAFQQEMAEEVRRGAQLNVARLNRHQRRTLYPVLQGVADLDNPARAVEQLQARRAQIVGERERRGVSVAKPLRRTNDELRTIDYAIEHAEQIFTPRLREFVEAEAQRSARLDAQGVGVRELTAEVRRLAPQADALGIPNPVEPIMARLEGSRSVRPYTGADPDVIRRAEDDIAAHRAAVRELSAARAAYEADVTETTLRTMLSAEQSARRTASRAKRARELLRLHADAVRLPKLQQEFVERVRRAAGEAGLPEPAYFTHSPHPLDRRSDFAVGSGNRAVGAPRRTTMSLHRTGRADQRPEAYIQGVARNVKRRHNWGHVDDQFQLSRVEMPSVPELRRILERDNVNPNALTPHDLQRVLLAQGRDLRDYAFYNPGRLRSGALARRQADEIDGPDLERAEDAARGLNEALRDSSIAADDLSRTFDGTAGWFPVTRQAYDEIHASTQPSKWFGRGVGKLQGTQSRVLLGTNPPWLAFQVASNAFLTGFGVRGNAADVVKAQMWWRRLDEPTRRELDQYLGQGLFEARTPSIGAASENGLVNAWRGFKSTAFVRRAGAMNPLDLMFRVDNAQNRFFKRAVLYNHVKRDAYQRLGRDLGTLTRAQEQVVNLLKLGPRERMRKIVNDPRAIERHAQAVLDVLGDYTRFTNTERRVLKRAVLFYGFLRYSLRTVFYTLPVRHPIAAGITGMLANLHNEEVRELLGGDEAPWAYSRVFFEGENGELRSIDLARMNPATNQFIDAIQMGPRKGFSRLAGLMSPLLAGIADQGYATSSFTGRPFTGHGDPNYWSGTDGDARWRIFVGDMLRTAFPYRAAERVMVGGRGTTDDSLLFAPRFVDYKTADAQAGEAERIRQAGGPSQRLTRELLPFLPEPDHTRETVRRLQARGRRRRSSVPVPAVPTPVVPIPVAPSP